MAMITEEARHELNDALRNSIGESPTRTLMNSLPPFDWADVATKQDLADMEERLTHRISSMLDQRISGLIFKLVFTLLGYQATFAGIVVAMLQFS